MSGEVDNVLAVVVAFDSNGLVANVILKEICIGKAASLKSTH